MPIVAVIVLVLQVDGVKDWLTNYNAKAPEYIVGFLIFAALLNHFSTSFSP